MKATEYMEANYPDYWKEIQELIYTFDAKLLGLETNDRIIRKIDESKDRFKLAR